MYMVSILTITYYNYSFGKEQNIQKGEITERNNNKKNR